MRDYYYYFFLRKINKILLFKDCVSAQYSKIPSVSWWNIFTGWHLRRPVYKLKKMHCPVSTGTSSKNGHWTIITTETRIPQTADPSATPIIIVISPSCSPPQPLFLRTCIPSLYKYIIYNKEWRDYWEQYSAIANARANAIILKIPSLARNVSVLQRCVCVFFFLYLINRSTRSSVSNEKKSTSEFFS